MLRRATQGWCPVANDGMAVLQCGPAASDLWLGPNNHKIVNDIIASNRNARRRAREYRV